MDGEESEEEGARLVGEGEMASKFVLTSFLPTFSCREWVPSHSLIDTPLHSDQLVSSSLKGTTEEGRRPS